MRQLSTSPLPEPVSLSLCQRVNDIFSTSFLLKNLPVIIMASRGGIRAAGTDGGDHMHRERVASHYAVR